MKILVTAFEPFGGETLNPASEALKRMKDNIAGAEIVKLEVVNNFYDSIDQVVDKMKEVNPDVVLSIGHVTRDEISAERIAININDAPIKDNNGKQPLNQTIFEDGKNAYFSTLPVKAMVKEMQDGGVKAGLSNSAGTFVCNHLMYGVLYNIEKMNKDIKAGWLHVPYMKEQIVGNEAKKDLPYMEIEEIVKGAELAVKAIVENKEDININLGKMD